MKSVAFLELLGEMSHESSCLEFKLRRADDDDALEGNVDWNFYMSVWFCVDFLKVRALSVVGKCDFVCPLVPLVFD